MKKIVSCFLVLFVLIVSFTLHASATELSDGTYEVQIALWHSEDDKESMAAAAVLPTATIVVEKDKSVMHIKCTTMKMAGFTGCVRELYILDEQGNQISATLESTDSQGYPSGYCFDLPHSNEYIDVKVNPDVAIMPMDSVGARIKVDYSTLQEVEATTVAETTLSTTSPEATTVAQTTSSAPAPETTTQMPTTQTTPPSTAIEAVVTTTHPTTSVTSTVAATVTTTQLTSAHSDTTVSSDVTDTEVEQKKDKGTSGTIFMLMFICAAIGLVLLLTADFKEEQRDDD